MLLSKGPEESGTVFRCGLGCDDSALVAMPCPGPALAARRIGKEAGWSDRGRPW